MSKAAVHLDFETRNVLDLKVVGVYKYVRTLDRILCAAYAYNDDEPTGIDFRAPDLKALRAMAADDNILFHAFNASFERLVWKYHMVPTYGMPDIPLKRWRCSFAKACAANVRGSLGAVARGLGVAEKKDSTGYQKMLKMCKPKKYNLLECEWVETDADYEALIEYCKQDVATERAIDKVLPDLSANEHIVWVLDQMINEKGMRVDTAFAQKAVDKYAPLIKDCNDRLWDLTDGAVPAVTQVAKIKKFCEALNYPVESLDKEHVALVLMDKTAPELVKQVVAIRAEAGQASIAKYRKMLDMSYEGDIHYYLLYHGAGTGRWAGAGFQPQNLPRPDAGADIADAVANINSDEDDGSMSELKNAIRQVLQAREGKTLGPVDYSAIEARVLFWISECHSGLEMFRAYDEKRGDSPYIAMAKMIYPGQEVSKNGTPQKYMLGKQTVLGSGYGMAAAKHEITCKKYGIDTDIVLSKKCIDSYRNTFPEVPAFWRGIEQAAKDAVIGNKKVVYKRLAFYIEGQFLCCRLPSGRVIRYLKPFFEGRGLCHWKLDKSGGYYKKSLYGGLITENICQGTARDILVNAMIKAWQRGFPSVLTVHDELVTEFDTGKDFNILIAAAQERPAWCADLPLFVEGHAMQRYGK